MKKLILFLVMLTIVSCQPLKKTEKLDVTQKQQSDTDVSKNLKVTENSTAVDLSTLKTDSSGVKALELIEKLTQDFNARLKTYDTDKPVDPQTGKPPLISELEISNKSTADKKTSGSESSAVKTDQKNNIQIDWNKVINSRIDSAIKANSKTIANTENVEKPVTPGWWIWLLVGIAIPITLSIVFYIIKQRFKTALK